LADNCGWRLHLDSEFARLQKTPADLGDGSRAAFGPKEIGPFTRRRYVVLCLALAALERGDRQTTLGTLADEVIALMAADPDIGESGVHFDLNSRDQRADLVHVIRFLLGLRVLIHVQGNDQQFLLQNQFVKEEVDVLYNINRPVLALMLNVRHGPSSIDDQLPIEQRMARLVHEPRPDTDDARNRALRFRLTRRLLDDPIVYFDELDDDEREYLTRQRGHLLRRIEEATGMIPEIRAEGNTGRIVR